MTDVPDAQLLEQFTLNGSEDAFAALVQRHIGLVHSVALRHTANPQHAEDIAQAVFIILARKAGSLGQKTILPGWLYNTARLAAANWQRAEVRRIRREQESFMQSILEEAATDALWQELRPQLDEAMVVLGVGERDALVLRYFQNKSMAEVGQILGLEENTAQKRVGRALEKLRKFFLKRGVDSSSAGIAQMISTHSVQPVPVALAKSVTATALANGAAASTSTLTIIKGAMKIMVWSKAKTAIAICVGILLAAGVTNITVKEVQRHQNEKWQLGKISYQTLLKAPHKTLILPTKSAQRSRQNGKGGTVVVADGRVLGINQPIKTILRIAYSSYETANYPDRIILNANAPADKFYDFLSNLPQGSKAALQREIESKFGLVGTLEAIETNVLLLKEVSATAAGLKTSKSRRNGTDIGNGYFSATGVDMANFAFQLENHLGIPVINQTELTNAFDFQISWSNNNEGHPSLNELNRVLTDQLGLELIPGTAPIKMLVVETAK